MADTSSSSAVPASGKRSRSSSGAGGLLLLGAVALLTIAGIISVLTTRYSVSDSYPEYSTLRTDPLGAGAIYEALERQPGIKVERNFQRLDRLKPNDRDTLVLLNVDAAEFNSPEGIDGEALQRWLLNGGRALITLSPRSDGSKLARLIHKAEQEMDEEELEAKNKQADSKAKPQSPEPKADSKAKAEPQPSPPNSAAADEDDSDAKDTKPNSSSKKKSRRQPRTKERLSLAQVLRVSAKAPEQFFAKAQGGSKLQAAPGLSLAPEKLPEWFSHTYLSDDPKTSASSGALS
jgi:hypothetical protein